MVKKLSAVFAVIAMAASCSDVLSPSTGSPETDVAYEGYNIVFNVSDAGVIETKSGTESDILRERNISKIDILFFTYPTGVFSSVVSSTEVVNVSGVGMANILLPYSENSDNTYMVLAVANVPYSASDYNSILAGKTVSQARNLLEKQSGQAKLNTNMAMSGELRDGSSSITLTSSTHQISFNMKRAVARYDIYATSSAVSSKFRLMTAELRNVRSAGYVFPSSETVHVPSHSSLIHYESNSDDDRDDDTSSSGSPKKLNCITQKLYSYENTTGVTASTYETTCLIVGGYYINNQGASTFGYYRINVGTKDSSGIPDYTAIRNTIYKINISDVTGIGYASKDEAYEGLEQNVTYSVTPWEEETLSTSTFDGKRRLSISTSLVQIGKSTINTVQTVNVSTENIAQGDWKVSKVSPGAWCELKNIVTTASGGYFSIKILENLPLGTVSRDMIFKVSSGDLSVLLTVRQTSETVVGILTNWKALTISHDGLPVCNAGVSPDDKQVFSFEFEGLSDLSATYSVHVSGDAASWCRVRDYDSREYNPENMDVQAVNRVVVEADELGEDEYRSGSLIIDLHHDFTVTRYSIDITQTYDVERVYLIGECLYTGTTTQSNEVSFVSNCDWYTDWGSAKISKFIYNRNTGDQSAEGSANEKCTINFSNTIATNDFYSARIKILSSSSNSEIGSIFVYSGMAGNSYPVYIKGKVYSSEFNYRSCPANLFWGRSVNSAKSADFNPEAWNAGSESNPSKGYADPCPNGWRMMTAAEFESLFEYGRARPSALRTSIYEILGQGTYWTSKIDVTAHKLYVAVQVNQTSDYNSYYMDKPNCRIVEVDYDPENPGQAISVNGSYPRVRCVRE